jgi:anti-anti-sigma factor
MYLIGDFGEDGVVDFERAWDDLMDAQVLRVTIDMSDTTFLDSAGIGCLVRARASGVEVALRGVRPAHQHLLAVAAVADVFDLTGPESSPLELTV